MRRSRHRRRRGWAAGAAEGSGRRRDCCRRDRSRGHPNGRGWTRASAIGPGQAATARRPPRPGTTPRLRHRRHPGDDRAARHGGGDRPPVAGGAGRGRDRGRRRPGPVRRAEHRQASSRCAVPSSSSRATSCPPRGGARRAGWRPSSGPRLAKHVAAAGLAEGGPAVEAWIADAQRAVLDVLADGTARTTREVRDLVPALDGRISVGGGAERKWGGEVPIGSRVLTALGAEGRIVRAANAGHWRLNKPAWTTTARWLGEEPAPLPEAEGYAVLVARWLATFGPGTEADIVWWLGATKTVVRRALADIDAEQVALDDGGTGWVLPGDTEAPEEVAPWAALLPTLDPTVMGWKERGFYLDATDAPYLFDSNGNAGNTAWWDGRIVGCWVQDDAARVHLVLREDVPAAGRKALAEEAERLTAWLDGTRVTNVYASPQMRGARLP
ncbi:winged helix DNA-binding domain-containing protein [Nocardioides convexus]|uniref:winged helix DNA-binding domain-containing protein n=1 Tax=Nocardioides convexus TaxID=2712224 RepID=UPI00241831EA|nr:winged helix DNA-binding domain-containing protein [Nocardioides convexus]